MNPIERAAHTLVLVAATFPEEDAGYRRGMRCLLIDEASNLKYQGGKMAEDLAWFEAHFGTRAQLEAADAAKESI